MYVESLTLLCGNGTEMAGYLMLEYQRLVSIMAWEYRDDRAGVQAMDI